MTVNLQSGRLSSVYLAVPLPSAELPLVSYLIPVVHMLKLK